MQFKNFIIEKVSTELKHLLIYTTKNPKDENGYYPTVKKIVEECKKRKLKFYVIFPERHFIDEGRSKGDVIVFRPFLSEDKEIEISINNTVAIVRGSIFKLQNGKYIYKLLEDKGVFCINSYSVSEISSNKYINYRAFKENGIRTPKSVFINKSIPLEVALKEIGGKFPVILKKLDGAEGIGISIVDSEKSLKGILQTFWEYGAELLLQEYLPIDGDIRIVVLDGEPLAVMKRNKISSDFRSNFSLGAKTEKYTLTAEEDKFVKKIINKLGIYFGGIDIFNVNGKLYAVEINASCGTEGIIKTTGINVVEKLVSHIMDKGNWKGNYKEVGYVEKAKLFSNDQVVFTGQAKLDTGNGITSSLHATNIKELGNKVEFELNGKKISKDIVRTANVVKHQGQFRDARIVVAFDILIGDKLLKDVQFGLANRMGTIRELEPILLSREIISRFKFSVLPDKKNVLDETELKMKFKDWMNEDLYARNGAEWMIKDGRYRIYWINHDYASQESFNDLELAKRYGLSKGFEFSVYKNGERVYSKTGV